MSPEHILFVHAKHEHKILRQFMNMALEEFSKQFIHAGFKKEGDELYEKFGWLLKEAGELPIPKSVNDGLVGSATTDDFVDENPPHIGEKRSYKIKLDN